MSNKRPYIGLIFDFKRVPVYYKDDSAHILSNDILAIAEKPKKKYSSKGTFQRYSNEYSNRRWALYCPCGKMIEIGLDLLYKDSDSNLTLDTPVKCIDCNKIYDSMEGVRMIYKKSINANVISRRFGLVEKDNFYALHSFASSVFISVTTKKLIFKDTDSQSLYFSKRIKAIMVSGSGRNNDKIITVPFKYLVKYCSGVINDKMDSALYEDVIPHGLFEQQIINPFIKFCEIVESKCDKRDVERINNILTKEREENYLELMSRGRGKVYYFSSMLTDISYEIENFVDSKSTKQSAYRYIWIQYLKRRLCTMLAVSMYAPLATLVLTYSPDKFLNLFTHSSLMCSLTKLRRKNPTNPKDIIEVMFKGKLSEEIAKEKRISVYIQKEKKKVKRKLKAQPVADDKLIYVTPTITHPFDFVDSRVPISKDMKKKVKALPFKKSYIDLFVEKEFDAAAMIFYSVLNNTSAFDETATIDKIIANYKIDFAFDLLTCIQKGFNSNMHRLEGLKMSYKNILHIVKICETDSNKNLSGIVGIYFDVMRMAVMMDLKANEVFKAKDKDSLNDIHNTLVDSYKLRLDKKKTEELAKHIEKFRHTEGVFEDVNFSLLDTAEKFYLESSVMNHCVKTYCTNVVRGHYVIYSIEDLITKDRATLSISIQNNSDTNSKIYTFNQLKAKNNAKSTEKIMGTVRQFIYRFFSIKNTDSSDIKITDTNFALSHIEDEILLANQLKLNVLTQAKLEPAKKDIINFFAD